MKIRHVACCVGLLCAVASQSPAQPDVKCGADLVMHQSLAAMGDRIRCIARFDIVQETPANVMVMRLDSTPAAGLIVEQTIENLSRLAFARDTFGLRLVFTYKVDHAVSAHYWKFTGPDSVLIVTPAKAQRMLPCVTETRSIDVTAKTLTLEGRIFTDENVSAPSAIVVEREFLPREARTKILENNYPQFAREIELAAMAFNLDRFQGSVSELESTELGAYRFLVRFRIVRMKPGARTYTVL